MVETKTIGEKRLEYLDLANKAYSSGDADSTQAFIDSFLTTIRDGTPVADEIQVAFDESEKKKNDTWEALVKSSSQLEAQMQSEQRYYGLQELGVLALKERLNACWQTSIKNGLFND